MGSGTTQHMFQLDSMDAKPPTKYAPSSEDPRLYFSLNHWPESHPIHGSREVVAGHLGQDLREAVREEFYKLSGPPESEAAFLPHIRLAGLVCPVHLTAHLRPTLWVDCASEWVRDVIKRALHQKSTLRWLGSETIIVQNNFVLATSVADFRDANLDLGHGHDIGHGRKVHFFLKDPGNDSSACGLRTAGVITHEGVIIRTTVHTLGGVLLVNEPVDTANSTGESVPARYG